MSTTLDQRLQSGVGDRPSSASLCFTSSTHRIYVTEQVFAAFARHLPDTDRRERVLILLGQIRDRDLLIDSWLPKLLIGCEISVQVPDDYLADAAAYAATIGRTSLGVAHTHPIGTLQLSEADERCMQGLANDYNHPWAAFTFGPRREDLSLVDPWTQARVACWIANPMGGRS